MTVLGKRCLTALPCVCHDLTDCENMVGAGPYMLTEWVENSSMTYRYEVAEGWGQFLVGEMPSADRQRPVSYTHLTLPTKRIV